MSEPERKRPSHRSRSVQRALAHPLRARLLVELEGRSASPSELAKSLNESVGVVSYHVRMLAEAELVELVGTVPRRGALQHYYRATDQRPVGVALGLSAAAAERLSREVREAVERARREPGDVPVVVVAHVEA